MAKGYHHLDEGVRAQIYILRVSEKKSLREIAKRVGCHASTVSRELKRNCGQRGYRYKQAQGKAVDRRASASRVSKKLTEAVVRDVEESLKKRWSPEQISGRLKQAGTRISHETIYRHVWLNKDQGGFLYKDLRHRGKKYNKKPNRRIQIFSPSLAGFSFGFNRNDVFSLFRSNVGRLFVSKAQIISVYKPFLHFLWQPSI